MKVFFLTTILVLTLCHAAYATSDCVWESSKSGVTISFVASCDFQNQSFIDSVVNKVVTSLGREDTSLKIVVYVNHLRLSFPDDEEYSNFFSIGFDTIREIDDDYIFNYYSNQENISMKNNKGWNMFKSQKIPLDINATNRVLTNEKGVKIIYNRDYRLGEPIWSDIIKSIIYSANNIGLIKREQTRDTVRYNYNGWYLSLVTIDTLNINRILGKEPDKKKAQTIPVVAINTIYLAIAVIAILVLFTIRDWQFTQRKDS